MANLGKSLFHQAAADLADAPRVPLALVGFGTVGQAVAAALCDLELEAFNPFAVVAIATRAGVLSVPAGIDLRKAVQARRSRHGLAAYGAESFTPDRPARAVLESDAPRVAVVVEMTPSNLDSGEPALSLVRRALDERRHVITANKGPVVRAMHTLCALAERRGVEFRYSATVGGGIPVVELLKDGLCGNRVLAIEGVLNGSSNYILSVMHEKKVGYQTALAQAQAAGITETDPTADVQGHDAAAKAVILANTAFTESLTLEQVSRVGISHLTLEDIRAAERQGKVYRLVAHVEPGHGYVSPRLVAYNSALAIEGAKNLVTFTCDRAGEIVVSGVGAGPRETASAVLTDLGNVWRATAAGARSARAAGSASPA